MSYGTAGFSSETRARGRRIAMGGGCDINYFFVCSALDSCSPRNVRVSAFRAGEVLVAKFASAMSARALGTPEGSILKGCFWKSISLGALALQAGGGIAISFHHQSILAPRHPALRTPRTGPDCRAVYTDIPNGEEEPSWEQEWRGIKLPA